MSGGDLAVVIAEVVGAVEAGHAEDAKLALHRYLHWTTAEGEVVRGRTKVLALLAARGMTRVPAPSRVELRDGQIYRCFS